MTTRSTHAPEDRARVQRHAELVRQGLASFHPDDRRRFDEVYASHGFASAPG